MRNSKWFAYGKILDFGYADPYGLPQISDYTSYDYNPAVANVCDFDGTPLIIVDLKGIVWVRGQYLGSVPSDNIVNIIIVPRPGHPDRYYLVSSGKGLSYKEVDLTNMELLEYTPLNDANGQPVLYSSLGGNGVASTTHANEADYWVTAFANDNLMSYLVTEEGISTTPTSSVSLPPSAPSSTLKVKISPPNYNSKRHIAIVNYYTGVSLKYFNDETGELTDDDSNMNVTMQSANQIGSINDVPDKDVEFSSDGSTLYFLDYWGGLYAIKEDGTYSVIDYYGGYVVSQLGPDGSVYFLNSSFNLVRLHPNAVDYPEYIGIELDFEYQYQQFGRLYLPPVVSINDDFPRTTLPPLPLPELKTPTFDAIPYVCSGMSFSPLPTSSNDTPPITGTWSPAFNNTSTTTYTFTPTVGLLANTVTMTVTVNPTVTPTFSDLSVLNDDVISYTLPTTSANWISGSWSPPTLAEGDNMYTFTPSGGTCVASVTKNYLWLKPKAISATDDNFYLRDTGNPWQLYQTPSVFDNDYTIFGGVPNSDDVDVQIVSIEPYDYLYLLDVYFAGYVPYPEINPDGTISFYGIDYFGPIYITYRIVQKSCPENYATATATFLLTNMSSTARQVAEEPQQLTDKLVIYPNPSTGIFNLDLTAIDEEYETIEVFNMLGAKIYEERLLIKSNNTIDLSDMAIGFYIAKVSGKNSSQTFQLIKQ